MSALSIGTDVDFDYPVLVPVNPDNRHGVVRDIRSAPSWKASTSRPPVLVEARALSAESVQPASSHAGSPVLPLVVGKIVAYLVALALVIGVGLAAGTRMQAPAYVGQTRSYSVSSGETLAQVANLVHSDRPLAEVVEDIRVLNNLTSDLLVPGQALSLPMQ